MWKLACASVIGTSHQQTSVPCQDASAAVISASGKWAVLVASDGAGSSAKSQIGSQFVVDHFAKELLTISEALEVKAPGAWTTDQVISSVIAARVHLRGLAASDDISAYHCTLVAALIGPFGGFIIHLGDGAAIAALSEIHPGDDRQLFISNPHNGEYANETVFLTERDWIKNIRIQPISAAQWMILGTDGGMALAMVGEKELKPGFIKPLLASIMSASDEAEAAKTLRNIISDKQADRLTNDDKTLIVAIRLDLDEVSDGLEYLDGLVEKNNSANQDKSPPKTISSDRLNAQYLGSTGQKHVRKIGVYRTFGRRNTLIYLILSVLLVLAAMFVIYMFDAGSTIRSTIM